MDTLQDHDKVYFRSTTLEDLLESSDDNKETWLQNITVARQSFLRVQARQEQTYQGERAGLRAWLGS